MIEVNPRKCVRCGYDADGLPRPHRCPECGLAFDLETWTCTRRRSWVVFALTQVSMGLAALAAIGVGQPILLRNGVGSFWAFAIPCTVVVVLYAFIPGIAEKWNQASWSITPGGLFIRDFGEKLVSWTDIDSFGPDPGRDAIVIVRLTGNRDPLYSPRFFAGEHYAHDFLLRLRSRMQTAHPQLKSSDAEPKTEGAA